MDMAMVDMDMDMDTVREKVDMDRVVKEKTVMDMDQAKNERNHFSSPK